MGDHRSHASRLPACLLRPAEPEVRVCEAHRGSPASEAYFHSELALDICLTHVDLHVLTHVHVDLHAHAHAHVSPFSPSLPPEVVILRCLLQTRYSQLFCFCHTGILLLLHLRTTKHRLSAVHKCTRCAVHLAPRPRLVPCSRGRATSSPALASAVAPSVL